MASTDLVSARFPRIDAGYESYYLRAAEPGGGRGFWIRYTVHRQPARPTTGSLWFTFFDEQAPTAVKTTLNDPRAGSGSWIRIGEATLGPGHAQGSIRLDMSAPVPAPVSWDLTFSGPDLFAHLPRPWMYDAPLPRTKPVSLHPAARITGNLVIGDRAVEVDGWPGMVGHNWGSEHAERWIWLHGTGFEGDDEAWLDVVLARLRIAGRVTPWSGFGGLWLDGRLHRLGGLSRRRSTRVEEHADRLRFSLAGHRARVRGHVAAPIARSVGWTYADPDGGEHDVVHCSVADLELTVERPGASTRTLRAPGVAAYELGMREHDHGVPIQPFPDGGAA